MCLYNEIKRWKLGIPFLKKYKLSFNAENRIISYYDRIIFDDKTHDDNGNSNGQNLNGNDKDYTWLKILIIVFLLLIFFVLGILLDYQGKRKPTN